VGRSLQIVDPTKKLGFISKDEPPQWLTFRKALPPQPPNWGGGGGGLPHHCFCAVPWALEHAITHGATPHLRPTHSRSRSLLNPSALLSTRPCRAPVPLALAPPTHSTGHWTCGVAPLLVQPLRSSASASSCSSSTTRRATAAGAVCQPSLRASFLIHPRLRCSSAAVTAVTVFLRRVFALSRIWVFLSDGS
jgi:hypothetical protein